MPISESELKALKNIERKINHYYFLDKHLEAFFAAVLKPDDIPFNPLSFVSSHGDKGRGAAMATRNAGIPFPHMMLMFMLTYTPYCKADFGKVRMEKWIIDEYPKLKHLMPEIDMSDSSILK